MSDDETVARINEAIVGEIVFAQHPSAASFERAYAERSGVTVEQLRRRGYCPLPCNCDDENCEGWGMAHLGETGAAALRAMRADAG